MPKTCWKSVLLAVIIIAATCATPFVRANAEEKSHQAVVAQWLNQYHDKNSLYLIFPNGQIFRARAKRTGTFTGHLNLWHCLKYMPLRYREDESIYLQARIVQFVDGDSNEIAARYKTQCALRSYPGDPYARIFGG